MQSFGVLFKKYRLRAEFATLSEFAEAFGKKGYFYDLSMYYRWQKGERIPKREVLLALINLFFEYSSMQTLSQANEFLASSGQGYLTEKEQQDFFSDIVKRVPKKDI